MTYKNIMRVIPIVQAASLVGENMKVLNKKKVKTKDVVNMGMKNIIGVSLIQAESQFINDL
jgi:hypothetical protein